MAWTTPKTWVDQTLVTAADLNEQVRDNLNAIRNPQVNVEQTIKTNSFSSSSTTFVDITGLAVTITPSTNTSKILIIVQIAVAGYRNTYQLVGGNTAGYIGDAYGSLKRGVMNPAEAEVTDLSSHSIVFLDSPATTSPVEYKVQMRRGTTTVATGFVNISSSTTNDDRGTGASSITAIEVAV